MPDTPTLKPEEITLVWSSAPIPPSEVELVVTIPTFKRPEHLLITLNSVLAQVTTIKFAIVVMDNHPEGSEGAAVAPKLLENHKIPATVILAHRRGNCAAYNAGFHIALKTYPNAKWIQVIDDDEIAPPHWLDSIVKVAEDQGTTFTGAPQHPIFDKGSNLKWAKHPVFRPPYESSGSVPILYSSGNVLISTNLLREHGYPWLSAAGIQISIPDANPTAQILRGR